MVMDVPPRLPDKPIRFMDQLRSLIRSRNLAYKTEQTYCHWIKRFIRFHEMRHPSTCSKKEVEQFLSHLAVQRNNSVSTQRTALNALVFLFREFLQQPFGELSFELARKPRRLPTVFSHDEAKAVIGHLEGVPQLVARLMYGSGLRINEVLRLRVKDIDFGMQQIMVRSGKGNKDRTTLLPESLLTPLSLQIEACLIQHKQDLASGHGEVYMPFALHRKYQSAAKEPAWQYLFPAGRLAIDPRSNIVRRHHLLDRGVQRAIGAAIRKAGIYISINRQTGKQPRSASQLCDPATRSRIRHSYYSKTTWPCRCAYHRNLYACDTQGRIWCAKSCRRWFLASR